MNLSGYLITITISFIIISIIILLLMTLLNTKIETFAVDIMTIDSAKEDDILSDIKPYIYFKFNSGDLSGSFFSPSTISTYSQSKFINNNCSLNTTDYIKGNASLSFNGNSYLQLNTTDYALNTNNFSIMFFAKIVYKNNGISTLFSHTLKNPTLGYLIRINKRNLEVIVGTNKKDNWEIVLTYKLWSDTDDTSVPEWYYITLTYDNLRANKWILYINGQEATKSEGNTNLIFKGITDTFIPSIDNITKTFNDKSVAFPNMHKLLIGASNDSESTEPINMESVKQDLNFYKISIRSSSYLSKFINNYENLVFIFKSGNNSIDIPIDCTVDILMVGGGGQGGCTDGGGGGAGGLVFVPNIQLSKGNYTIIVGNGGSSAGGNGGIEATGSNGEDTIISKNNSIFLIAKGGGGGGTGYIAEYFPNSGGSGGGAGSKAGNPPVRIGKPSNQVGSSAVVTGNSLKYGFGNKGGDNDGEYNGAGGGGAGESGHNSFNTTKRGLGGNGLAEVVIDNKKYNFTQIFNLATSQSSSQYVGELNTTDGNIYFAGGGGGGHYLYMGSWGSRKGGLGGGGTGDIGIDNRGRAYGGNALNNTGGGGGGGGGNSGRGGNGGSGIVIIRFRTADFITSIADRYVFKSNPTVSPSDFLADGSLIDDLRIYSQTLAPEQINTLYLGTPTGSSLPPPTNTAEKTDCNGIDINITDSKLIAIPSANDAISNVSEIITRISNRQHSQYEQTFRANGQLYQLLFSEVIGTTKKTYSAIKLFDKYANVYNDFVNYAGFFNSRFSKNNCCNYNDDGSYGLDLTVPDCGNIQFKGSTPRPKGDYVYIKTPDEFVLKRYAFRAISGFLNRAPKSWSLYVYNPITQNIATFSFPPSTVPAGQEPIVLSYNNYCATNNNTYIVDMTYPKSANNQELGVSSNEYLFVFHSVLGGNSKDKFKILAFEELQLYKKGSQD